MNRWRLSFGARHHQHIDVAQIGVEALAQAEPEVLCLIVLCLRHGEPAFDKVAHTLVEPVSHLAQFPVEQARGFVLNDRVLSV